MSRNKHTYTRHASWLVLHVLSNLSPCVLNRLWEKESSRTCTKFVLILTRAFRARDNLVFIVAKSNTYRSVPVKYSSIGGPLLHAVCNTALRVSQEPKNLFSQPKKRFKSRCEHDPYLTYHLYRSRQNCQRRRYRSRRWGRGRRRTRRCSCRSTGPRSRLCIRTWNRRNNWYTLRQTYTD